LIPTLGWSFETAVRTLAQEARGEPLVGQKAVAAVMVNRAKDGRWGTGLASVCLWPHQFSGWANQHDPNFAYACGLRDDDPVIESLRPVLAIAIGGDDPTGGALFYYAKSIPAPAWAATMKPLGQFGHQLFFTDRPSLVV
jgi:spore germination cell wall hydrolase CwlJ-like protein